MPARIRAGIFPFSRIELPASLIILGEPLRLLILVRFQDEFPGTCPPDLRIPVTDKVVEDCEHLMPLGLVCGRKLV